MSPALSERRSCEQQYQTANCQACPAYGSHLSDLRSVVLPQRDQVALGSPNKAARKGALTFCHIQTLEQPSCCGEISSLCPAEEKIRRAVARLRTNEVEAPCGAIGLVAVSLGSWPGIPHTPSWALACSKAWATRMSVLSSKWRARSCMPMGRPSRDWPQGREIPGTPARSAVTV
jgi:hypothetical protein